MKNPFRRHTHAESDNKTLSVFAILTFVMCILTVFSITREWGLTFFFAFGGFIVAVMFKLELAMF